MSEILEPIGAIYRWKQVQVKKGFKWSTNEHSFYTSALLCANNPKHDHFVCAM